MKTMMNNEQTAASPVIWTKTDGLCKHLMPRLVDNMREKVDTICGFSESVRSRPHLLFMLLAAKSSQVSILRL